MARYVLVGVSSLLENMVRDMIKLYGLKRRKYLNFIIRLKCFLKTKNIHIKMNRDEFKKLVKFNKDSEHPYVVLSTYGSEIDPCIMQRNFMKGPIFHMFSRHVSTPDYNLINKALSKKLNIVIYPEKYTSLDGTTSYIDRDIIKLLKKLDNPVKVCINHGTYVCAPKWRYHIKLGYVSSEIIELFSREDLHNLDEESLYERLVSSMYYNDFLWLKEEASKGENSILDIEKIVGQDKNRCEGIDTVLYKCPSCLEENKMMHRGNKIYCICCGKQWKMTPFGDMHASLDDTEYASLHNWYNFERDCIKEEIKNRTYKFVGKVRISILSGENRIKGGSSSPNKDKRKVSNTYEGIMWHGIEGIILKYNLGNKEEDIIINIDKLNTVQINYDNIAKETCIEIPWNDTIIKVCFGMEAISAAKLIMINEELYLQYCNLSRGEKDNFAKSKDLAVTVDVEDLLEAPEKVEYEIENAGNVIAVEYMDDNEVTSMSASRIRQSAKTVLADDEVENEKI